MPRIRCTNPSTYALTRGRIYTGEVEGNYYRLQNDNGANVRYSSRLFETVPGRAAATDVPAPGNVAPVAARPVAPPPPPRRTETDMVRSITVVGGVVAFHDLGNTQRRVENAFTVHGRSNISCGITQISGINNMIERIDNLFDLDDDDFVAIRKALLKKCIQQYVKTQTAYAMAIMSTNVSGTDSIAADPDMLAAFDEEASVTTAARNNPNSNRNIKMWTFYLNQR